MRCEGQGDPMVKGQVSMEFFTLYLLVILSFTLFMVMFGEYSIYLTKVLNDLEARKTAIIIARSANMVVFSGNGFLVYRKILPPHFGQPSRTYFEPSSYISPHFKH